MFSTGPPQPQITLHRGARATDERPSPDDWDSMHVEDRTRGGKRIGSGKQCPKCLRWKPWNQWGKAYWCKSCMAKNAKRWRRRNKDRVKAQKRRQYEMKTKPRAKLRQKILERLYEEDPELVRRVTLEEAEAMNETKEE